MADWDDESSYNKRRGARSSNTKRTTTANHASNLPPGTTTAIGGSNLPSTSITAINSQLRPSNHTEEDARTALVEKARQEREDRARRKRQEEAAARIQAVIRGWLARTRIWKELLDEIQRKLQDVKKIETVMKAAKKEFVLPVAASVKLTRSGFILHRLRPKAINVNKGKLKRSGASVASDQIEQVLNNLAVELCGTIRNGSLQTIWDDGARLRIRSLVANELQASCKECQRCRLCRELIGHDFFFEWMHMLLSSQQFEPLVRSKLTGLASGAQDRVDGDVVDVIALAHIRLMQRRNDPKYGLVLFSTPGIFLRISAVETFQAITQPIESWDLLLKSLTNVHKDTDRGAVVLSRTGNLFSLIAKVPQLGLATDRCFEAIWNLFIALPKNTFVGTEGVAWTGGQVAKVDSLVMTQLDILSHIITLLGERCLKVNPLKESVRREADRKEWESIGQGVMEKSSSATTASSSSKSSGSRIFSIMSSSNWAKKLGWTGSSSKAKSRVKETEEEEELLAKESPTSVSTDLARQPLFVRETALSDFLKLLAVFLLRWPPKAANPKSLSLLNALSFTWPSTVDRLWAFADSKYSKRTAKPDLLDEFWSSSFVFLFTAVHFLLVTDESELYENGVPLARGVIERCVTKMNEALFQIDYSWLKTAATTTTSSGAAEEKKTLTAEDHLVTTNNNAEFARVYVVRAVRFLAQLRDMHSRRPLTREQAWLLDKSASASGTGTASASSFFASLLPVALGGRNESGRLSVQEQHYFDHGLYWCVPFYRRARWFSELISTERVIHQPPDQPPQYKLSVRRRNGGLDEALPFFLKSDLRKRVYVVFVNELGLPEAGIDSRGLLKEFIQTLAELVFDPKRGLFAVSQEGDKGLFPNPRAKQYVPDTLQMFHFAGRLLGKALFEGIVIQPEFSFFILAKLLGKLVTISALASLDQDLFRNLIFLKNTSPQQVDLKDLCLTFSVTSASANRELELFPGGSNVEVNHSNKYKYVNMVAHYRLNVEGKEEHDAFISGFRSVIAPEWIAPFTERELQTLISGQGGKIDLADLKANCVYGGGYFSTSQVILWFWEIVEREMDDREKELLLRFVTACTRPPLLGFSQLEPRFQIQRVSLENMQLPTASTCFNTLKIPSYPSKSVLREKLMKAITSGAGFELT